MHFKGGLIEPERGKEQSNKRGRIKSKFLFHQKESKRGVLSVANLVIATFYQNLPVGLHPGKLVKKNDRYALPYP